MGEEGGGLKGEVGRVCWIYLGGGKGEKGWLGEIVVIVLLYRH